MSTGIRPRGRLPQRVYWFRRGIVVVVALALVFGIGHLLGGSGSSAPAASDTAAKSSSGTTAPRTTPATVRTSAAATTGKHHRAPVVLAEPDGPCLTDEVTATPVSRTAQAGRPIALGLVLTTTRAACTFRVSSATVAVKVTSGSDRIWSSQDCPHAVPSTDVILRAAKPVRVAISWSGRRSDSTCSNATEWANVGFYHAAAAPLGGQATDVQFELVLPKRRVIVRTAKPKPHPTSTPTSKPTATPTSGKTGGPSGKGSKCGGDNAASSC